MVQTSDKIAFEYIPPELAVIVPSYNERDNIALLYKKISECLDGTVWEMIVVDDNSPDRTADVVNELSREHRNVHCISRIGRRGLASACIEGFCASSAPYVAVIDADLQHDEAKLLVMLAKMREGADMVVGSRFVDGGSAGDGLSATRLSGSNLANRLANMITRQAISDPMSGFFMLRRDIAFKAIPHLVSDGFKILMDLIVTLSKLGCKLKIQEVGYVFRPRHAGESKMSPLVVVQYLGLWFSKLTGGALPPTFVLFSLVGGTGVAIHLLTLWLCASTLHQDFVSAQVIATLAAMTWNFFLNNNLTYADRKLRGPQLITGMLSFFAICAIGGIANISVASTIYEWDHATFLAGLAGALMSSVFNYAVTRAYTWK